METDHPNVSLASFWTPDYLPISAWVSHGPFAFWLTEQLKPRRFVELGTHFGYSFFAFCQAIQRLDLGTAAFAVDTWKGDEHAGLYEGNVFNAVAAQNARYRSFATLMAMTFDEALTYVDDGSVDLLHIDGRHHYEDVQHDYETWLPKLTDDAVVVFHDTNVRERDFGVWKFFKELSAKHPSFQFIHGHGLGVLCPGSVVPEGIRGLLDADPVVTDTTRLAYAALGGALEHRRHADLTRQAIVAVTQPHADLSPEGLRALASAYGGDPIIAYLGTILATTRSEVETTRVAVREASEARQAEHAALLDVQAQLRASTEASIVAQAAAAAQSDAARDALERAHREAEHEAQTVRDALARVHREAEAAVGAAREALARAQREAETEAIATHAALAKAQREVEREADATRAALARAQEAQDQAATARDAMVRAQREAETEAAATHAALARAKEAEDQAAVARNSLAKLEQEAEAEVNAVRDALASAKEESETQAQAIWIAQDSLSKQIAIGNSSKAFASLASLALKARDRQLQRLRDVADHRANVLENHGVRDEVIRAALLRKCTRLVDARQTIVVLKASVAQAGARRDEAEARLGMVGRSRAWRLARKVRRLLGRPGDHVLQMSPLPASDMSAANADRIRSTGLFDDAYYLATNPDVAATGEDPAAHFAEIGWAEGRWPNPAFDPAFYVAANRDIAASTVNPLLHYAECGLFEDRAPLAILAASPSSPLRSLPDDDTPEAAVRNTDLFDDAYYRLENADVVSPDEDPAVHYATQGWAEGLKPNPAFDPTFYAVHYEDVARLESDPLLHYAEHGLEEGRETMPGLTDQAVEDNFDGLSIEEADLVRAVDETGLFDRAFYMATYPDVVRQGKNLLHHYALTGWKENRKPNAYFDPAAYLALNRDVAHSGANPLLHFAQQGLHENRPFQVVEHTRAGRISSARARPAGLGASTRLPSPGEAATTDRRWPVKLPDLFALRDHRPTGRLAVVAHVFYADLWPEIAEAVGEIPERFDLFVSLVEGQSEHLREEIAEAFPDAHLYTFANRGRDILPFMAFAATGALARYELICKVHTKRSLHREDGDIWRRHLISSILSDDDRIQDIVAAFDTDPDLGLVVADGQIFQSEETWAGNVAHLETLAPLLGYSIETISRLSFAGGSMFWMRAMLLGDLVGLGFEPEAYEPEPLGTDGTLAHAMERLFSVVCHSAGMRIEMASVIPARPATRSAALMPSQPPSPRVVAFYLPQFHPIPENDRWWGRGFTEWTNVTKAQPLFPGHRQPRLPGELGFTDLRLPETRMAQAELARAHGISAFCYYHYWFGENKKLLHRPLDEVLASREPDFPFMICWANEPWSRNWDGANKEILVPQDYEEGWVEAFAREVAPIMADPRYVRLGGPAGRPVLMIYRIMHVPSPAKAMAGLRVALKDLGIANVHLSAGWLTLGDDVPLPDDPADLGLDSFFEFPPHRVQAVAVPAHTMPPGMTGGLYDYAATVDGALERLQAEPGPVERHHAVMMGWDNTARRGSAAYVFRGATPAHLRRWLRGVIQRYARAPRGSEERLIFVNAWNEWAEGTCLEPDRVFGRGWLEAVAGALGRTSTETPSDCREPVLPDGRPTATRSR